MGDNRDMNSAGEPRDNLQVQMEAFYELLLIENLCFVFFLCHHSAALASVSA